MQKEIKYLWKTYLLVLMAYALFSCSKERTEPLMQSDMPLVFSPTTDWPQMVRSGAEGSTKALINNTTELQAYGISLLATATKGGNIYPVFNNDNLKFTGSSWDYGSTKYWIPGANYSFAAFAPYAAPSGTTIEGVKHSNGTVTVSAEPTKPSIRIENYITGRGDGFDARNEDLLYANYSRYNMHSDDYSPVDLEFEHLLACVSFYIRNATNEDIVKVDNIKLSGLEYMCNWTINLNGCTRKNNSDTTPFTSDERAASGESGVFLPKGMTEQDSKPLFDCTELTVLPQQLSGRGITVSFRIHYPDSNEDDNTETETVNYTGNLSTIESITRWEAGKKYRYNITISSSEITFQVAEVPWIENNVEL